MRSAVPALVIVFAASPSRAAGSVVPDTCRPCGQITGRVVHRDGTPVTHFFLDGNALDTRDGKFDLRVRPGSWRLVIVAPGLASTLRFAEAREGTTVAIGDVIMTPGHPIRGRVVDASTGEPVADALIDITEQSLSEESEANLQVTWGAVRSQRDGSFVLHVEEKAPTLIVVHERYPQKWLQVDRHKELLVVKLERGATLRGAIAESAPSRVEVKLVRKDGRVSRSATVDNHRYELFGIPPGLYYATVWDRTGPRSIHPVIEAIQVQIHGTGVINKDLK